MANEMRSRRDDTVEDPLAELARLMAQEDEFAGLVRDLPRAAVTPQARPAAPRAPMAPIAPPRAPAPSPRSTNQPGSFAALAAEVYADAPGRPTTPLPRSERHSLEDAARDANRSFTRPESRAPEPRAPEARSPEPRPYARPSESLKPFDHSRISDSAAQAVSTALGESFDLPSLDPPRAPRPASEMAPSRAPMRTEPPRSDAPLPTWMARAAAIAPEPALPVARRPVAPPPPAPPAVETRDFGPDDDAYDYGRSAVETDTYVDDRIVDSEDAYGGYEGDEAPRRGRGRLGLVAGVVAVVVVGGAGLYAYRSMSGGSATIAGEPPVIRAEQSPNKVVPAKPAGTEQASGDGQKLIYDRVGGNAPAGGERVVSSEEQPVDVSQAAQPQPRVIQPATGSTPTAVAPTNPTEPKRVRTLTVRADGSIVEDASPTPTPGATAAQPSALAQTTASTPVALSPGTGAPAPTSPTPMAATPSIVPNVPLPPTRMAAAPPATAAPAPVAAAPAAATAAAGGFFVQVASARSEADAQTAWRAAQSKYPGVLNGQTVAFRRADLGDRGIYYRAQVGPFGSREDANGLCQSLRAQGGDCMVQRN